MSEGYQSSLADDLADDAAKSGGKRKYSGSSYNGPRNPDMDFTNKKGKSSLKIHFDDHKDDFGYITEMYYLQGTRNFLEKNLLLQLSHLLQKMELILDMI